MTPLETIIAVCGLIGFLLACLGFVATIWKASWAIRGFVDAENKRAETEQQILVTLREFIGNQQERDEQITTTVRVLARDLREVKEHVFEPDTASA